MNRNGRQSVANVKAALLGDKIISDNEMAAILATIDAVQLAGTVTQTARHFKKECH